MALPLDVSLAAARLSKSIFDISRETIDDERDAAAKAYQAAVLVVVDRVFARVRKELRKVGPDSTLDERREAKRIIANLVEDGREDVAALHRPALERMVDLAREHAEALGVGEPEAGLVILEASVLRITRDAQEIFNVLIETVFAAIDSASAVTIEDPDAEEEELIPVGFFGTLRGRFKSMVTILSAAYVLTKLDAFVRRRVVRVRFIHEDPFSKTHPCVICAPFINKTFPIQTAPIPPLHVSCDCDLEPVT